MLSQFQKQTIVKHLPTNIKLYNGQFAHNKVYNADYYRIIPKGKKYFVIFKKYNTRCYAYFLEINNYRLQIVDVVLFNACFNDLLTLGKYGTICFGTIFYVNNIRCFSIENVHFYKNKKVDNKSWSTRFSIMKKLFENIKQVAYTSNDIIFGLPIICKKKETIPDYLKYINYPVYCIECLFNNNNKILKENPPSIIRDTNATFMIKSGIKSDIYHLYCEGKKISTACIPTYKLSVLMNSYFRTIKENINLDYLEESDDDDEFENVDLDKFVDLDKELAFECQYNAKFKMWVPTKYSERPTLTKLSTIKYLI